MSNCESQEIENVEALELMVNEIFEDWMFNRPFNGILEEIFYTSSDSDSSEEEEPRNKRVCIKYFIENVVHLYSNTEFQSHFRLSRPAAYNLIEKFRQKDFLDCNNRIEDFKYERAILVTLWYLANLETIRQIADRFDLARSTAHKIILTSLDFIISLCDEYIKWPNDDEKMLISHQFFKRQRVDGIIGAIDGCHVRIRRPSQNQEDFLNRKKFHSVILQAVVTPKKLFKDVYIGEPGSMHDARVLRRSPLYERALEEPNFFGNYFLLGDSAYPNLPWLVPPFKDNGRLSRSQRLFNYKHSCSRVIVEQSFGLLRSRFRRLLRLDNFRIDIINKCILACCILHNICILENENDSDDSSNDENNLYDNIDNYNNEEQDPVDDEDDEDIRDESNKRKLIFNQMFRRNNNAS